jgi:rhamnose utilization protein RhaD (predicted bifunctional aldolase and dehydrogenase)
MNGLQPALQSRFTQIQQAMDSLWNETTAQGCATPLALRAYTSRLIGGNPDLVLHGGGNTSLKTTDTLYVKSTGFDLASVDDAHFTALDLDRLRRLIDDPKLSDAERMRGVDACKMNTHAAKPSIETLMHAVLPYSHVEHAHADAVLAVANVEACETNCSEVFGELAPLVPYRHSGAGLALACRQVFETRATSRTIGLILAFHGVVAFGNSARESYANLLRLVTVAEEWLRSRNAWALPVSSPAGTGAHLAEKLRVQASNLAGFPLSMRLVSTPETLAFARRADLADVTQQGPPTPQHAIYTKRLPLIDGDMQAYAERYRIYLQQTLGEADHGLDVAPRIVLDPVFGLCAFGVNDHYAGIAAEIYLHDIAIISRASAHGCYRSASAEDIARAELEYGGFEQRVRQQQSA